MLEASSSDLTLGYMDDVTLGGSIDKVSSDVKTIQSEGEKIGLHLNVSKCEIISSRASFSAETANFLKVSPDMACVLGAPLIMVKLSMMH